MKSESFRKQALCLVLFFAAVAAVFALTRLRSDPAKKQAEFVVQQLLSCSSAVEQAVEQAVDAAAPSGSEPGLAAVDTDGLYAFLQAQLGDAMTADCLDKVMANRLPTRITALAGQSGDKLVPADLTLKKRAGAENCYDFSAALLTATDSTAAGSTITKDVPAQALGIARERQTNLDGWAEPKMEAYIAKKQKLENEQSK